MPSYRQQRYTTITSEQREFVEANFGKMNLGELSKMLGITYNKLHNNLRVMGKVKPKPRIGNVIVMEGYFDEIEFFKKYRY